MLLSFLKDSQPPICLARNQTSFNIQHIAFFVDKNLSDLRGNFVTFHVCV